MGKYWKRKPFALNKEPLLAAFQQNNWRVEFLNSCHTIALPTPKAVLLEGATMDAFPLEPVELEWVTIRAV